MTAIRATLPYQSYRFSGDDALTFLQGQLTQDLAYIRANTCHYGAYCDPKARMLANCLIYGQKNDYVIRLHARQADSVIKRLTLFRLRSQVAIEPLSAQVIGLNRTGAAAFCQLAEQMLPEVFHCVRHAGATLCALPNDYFELSLPNDCDVKGDAALSAVMAMPEAVEAIMALRLRGGHFDIVPETSEWLMPQQTPLEAWGGINYQKGCYVGQEVIARNKYKGKVRKGLGYALLDGADDIALQAGVVINGRKVGQVVEVYRGSARTHCLALLSLESFGQLAQLGGSETQFSSIP